MGASSQEDSGKRLTESAKAIVEGIATREGFKNIFLDVSEASAKGDNYVGVIYRVRITGSRDGKDGQSMSLIMKCSPESQEKQELMQIDNLFNNEVSMYSEVLPAFARLQKERGLSEDQMFSSVAKWHACDRSEGNITLVLEDMSPQGYRLGDRLGGLDVEHCSLVIKELAKLHALSFALRDQRPDELQRLRSHVQEIIFKRDPSRQKDGISHGLHTSQQAVAALLKRHTPESQYVKRFQQFNDEYEERMLRAVSGEAAEPYSVICHGDCWTNNFLFKYSEDGNTPVAVCLLDMQLARYGSPMTDIAYFLYTCTEGDVRRKAYKSLMSDYYESFSQFLRMLGSDPEKMFPYSAFEEQESKFSQFGLGMAAMALPVVTAPSDDTFDFDNFNNQEAQETYFEKVLSYGLYPRRISDVIEDMVDRNFI